METAVAGKRVELSQLGEKASAFQAPKSEKEPWYLYFNQTIVLDSVELDFTPLPNARGWVERVAKRFMDDSPFVYYRWRFEGRVSKATSFFATFDDAANSLLAMMRAKESSEPYDSVG